MVDLDLPLTQPLLDGDLPGVGPLEGDAYAAALTHLANHRDVSDVVEASTESLSHHPGGVPHHDTPSLKPPWCWLFPRSAGCN